MLNKQAYLIICHNNFRQLGMLLELIDDKKNDIFIHVDKKSKDYSINELKTHVTKGTLTFVKSINVNWGGSSMIKAEMLLLKEATKSFHMYYHLISGVDLPLKTQEEIYAFLSKNFDKNYISIDNYENDVHSDFTDRVRYYYPFQNTIGRNRGVIPSLCYNLQEKLLLIQKKIGVNRIKKLELEFVKGGQWFSITHDAALYVLDSQKLINKIFRWTNCADEIFLQTVIYNSEFKDSIDNNTLRYIDWNRGSPYTFREDDYDVLINSNCFFARKFDINTDERIINLIYNYLR